MNVKEFNAFFKVHSQNVDNSENLGFWKLTDDLIEHYLLEQMKRREGVTIADFGGGTGRWLKRLDKYFINSKFIIVDLSKDMLNEARNKIDRGDFHNIIELFNCDISNISMLKDESVDYVISTYNPLSFVKTPQLAINEALRVLKKGGSAMITIQGYYNALYSKLNNSLCEADELLSIFNERKVKWNDSVPALWQLSKQDMENMFKTAGFSKVSSRGISTITQPQGEDFDPENKQLGSLSKKLNENGAFYKAVFEIEKQAGTDQDAINRAMNIMTIGEKN